MSIEVGGERFASKVALKRRVQGILRAGPREITGNDAVFLLSLFERHQSASEKFGCGIKTIRAIVVLPYKTVGFEIERTDGTRTDISYLECTKPSTPAFWFRASCRSAVVDQIQSFKGAAFSAGVAVRCEVTGEPVTRDESHVDHAPPWTFDAIVTAFIGERGLNPAAVEYVDGDGVVEYLFSDEGLIRDFADFHRTRATLRVVSKIANLSLLRKGSR